MFKVKLATSPTVNKYLRYKGKDWLFNSRKEAERTCALLGIDLDYVEIVEAK